MCQDRGSLAPHLNNFLRGNPEWGTRKLSAACSNTVVPLQPGSCGLYLTVTVASSVYPTTLINKGYS